MTEFREVLARFAVWLFTESVSPDSSVPLLLLVIVISSLFLFFLHRRSLSLSRLPRPSEDQSRPVEGVSDKEGLGEVPEDDEVPASAERWSDFRQSEAASARQIEEFRLAIARCEREVVARLIEHRRSGWDNAVEIVNAVRAGRKCHPECDRCEELRRVS